MWLGLEIVVAGLASSVIRRSELVARTQFLYNCRKKSKQNITDVFEVLIFFDNLENLFNPSVKLEKSSMT